MLTRLECLSVTQQPPLQFTQGVDEISEINVNGYDDETCTVCTVIRKVDTKIKTDSTTVGY